jgi:hypothetical protein
MSNLIKSGLPGQLSGWYRLLPLVALLFVPDSIISGAGIFWLVVLLEFIISQDKWFKRLFKGLGKGLLVSIVWAEIDRRGDRAIDNLTKAVMTGLEIVKRETVLTRDEEAMKKREKLIEEREAELSRILVANKPVNSRRT